MIRANAVPFSHTFSVRRPTHIHHMYKRVRMPQVVQELVPQPFTLVRPGHQARNIQQLDGHRARPVHARAVVGLAPVRHAVAGARAGDLEVADGALGVDGREAGGFGERGSSVCGGRGSGVLTGSCLGSTVSSAMLRVWRVVGLRDLPTLEEASVKLRRRA